LKEKLANHEEQCNVL